LANMWKNSLKNLESDNNKMLDETLLLCCSLHFCVVLCIVFCVVLCIVTFLSFCVFLVCKCVLY
jgi:hypothetical protein